MHAFAGTSRTFFSPALTAGLWLPGIQELLPEILHVMTLLYACEAGCIQIKFIARIIYNFFFG
jgi:hypothetical protein